MKVEKDNKLYNILKIKKYIITISGTEHQTVTLSYTEPDGNSSTKNSATSDIMFAVPYGTTWTATVTSDEGYNAGTLSTVSGTVIDNTTISVGEAVIAIIRLTDSRYKMSRIYPDTYQTMTEVPAKLDSSNVTNMSEMFKNCSSLITIPRLDTSKVTSMDNMFNNCTSLTAVTQLDTSNVTNMSWMFYNCSSLSSEFPWVINCLNLNGNYINPVNNMFTGSSVTKVTFMNVPIAIRNNYINNLKTDDSIEIIYIDYIMKLLYNDIYQTMETIPDISDININYTIDLSNMFANCNNLTSIPQLNTSNIIKMRRMFYNCSSLTSIPVLDTSNVTDMLDMFYGCTNLTTIPELDTSNVTSMQNMFYNCSSLASIPELDTSNVTSMQNMFYGCTSLPSTFPWVIDFNNVEYNNNMFKNSSVTTVRLRNVKSQITSKWLKGDDTLTIEFVD